MERTPSENAWLKIQEKQPVRHRKVVWGWYAAAGVAAAVMGGYLVWQNQQGVSPHSIQSERTIAAARPMRNDSAVSPVNNAKQPVEQIVSVEKTGNGPSDNALAGSGKNDNREKLPAAQIAKAPVKTQDMKTPATAPAPVQGVQEFAINEKPSVSVNAIQPEPLNMPVAQDIKTLPDEPAVSRVNKPEAEPTRTIVVAVETGTNEVEEKPRNTRFARVFRQLKNARAGEKVDWDEVGFNPKNLVARVDDRLRSKDDKKDHPKEKTKL